MLKTAIDLQFHEPTIEDAAWAAPMLRQSGMKSCEFSFTTIYMWRQYYNNQIARYGNFLFIRSGDVEPLYLLPVGGDLREGIELLRQVAHDRSEPLLLFGGDADIKARIEAWYPGVFDWQPSPADFDYIYNADDLALLGGRKYHGKRNHIAAFNEAYRWTYETIDDSNCDEATAMICEWCRERGNCSDPGLRSERLSIREALKNRKALSLTGGLLRVDGKVIAMTMASPISDEVVDVHSEKALTAYEGAYAVINQEFVKRELQGRYRLINRENDLGIDGLRRAKQSYHPALLLEKYLATEIV